MNTVYKYPLNLQHYQRVTVPVGAKIIHIGRDPMENLSLWAVVDSKAPTVHRDLYMIGTGHPIPPEAGQFLTTLKDGDFMWHFFEGN